MKTAVVVTLLSQRRKTMTSSKPDYPKYEFVPTRVVSNGETLAKQYKKNGAVVTDISLPKESAARKTKLQNLLNQQK